MAEASIKILKERQDAVRNNWGFIFALACAVLWGTCYQGIGIIFNGSMLNGFSTLAINPYVSGLAIACFLTFFTTVFSLLWIAYNRQIREWLRFVTTFHYSNVLCIACALCGGIAAWCTYVIAFSIDATFSVIIVMFYPAIGMLISKRWLNERVTKNLYYGLAIIVFGWVILYLPEIASSQQLSQLPIYLIGALAGVCWGIEGALASRVMETLDSSVAVAARYSYEAIFIVAIAVVVAILTPESFTPMTTLAIGNPANIFLILIVVAGCLAANYLCWYKSFLLCGVSRGLAVSGVSGFVIVIVGMLLLTSFPSWPAVCACVLMLCGVFIIYHDSTQDIVILRDNNLSPLFIQTVETFPPPDKIPEKMLSLLLIAKRGPLWDYEIAGEVSKGSGTGSKGRQITKRARVHLIEIAAAGLIIPLEYALDKGTHFGEGKLLTRYALTEYGKEILQKNLRYGK